MLDAIWGEVRRQLRACLLAKDFDTWIAPLRATAWEAGELTVEVPSSFSLDWIRGHYHEALTRSLETAAGRPAGLKLVVNRDLEVRPPSRRPPLAAEKRPAKERVVESRCTFETFVVGESNQVAFEAARSVVERPGLRFNPLFVYGGTGLGKTHLLTATASAVAELRSVASVAYLTAEAFVNEMISALRRHQMERFRQRFRGIGTLDRRRHPVPRRQEAVAGGVHAHVQCVARWSEADRDRVRSAAARAARLRGDAAQPVRVRAPRRHPAAGSGRCARRSSPARRATRGSRSTTTVMIASGGALVQHGRQLEGVLRRIEAFAAARRGSRSRSALVREALAPYCVRRSTAAKSVGRIVGEVCRHYQVTPDGAHVAAGARRASRCHGTSRCILCRRHTDAPLGAIGKELGGRDHSTVVHALGAIEERLRRDADLRATVSLLEARLGG